MLELCLQLKRIMKRTHILIGKNRIGVLTPNGSSAEVSDAKTRSQLEKLVAQRQELGRKMSKLLKDGGIDGIADDEPTESIQ